MGSIHKRDDNNHDAGDDGDDGEIQAVRSAAATSVCISSESVEVGQKDYKCSYCKWH